MSDPTLAEYEAWQAENDRLKAESLVTGNISAWVDHSALEPLAPSLGAFESRQPCKLVLTVAGIEQLRIVSDGLSNFTISGPRLRWRGGEKVEGYETDDDLHVRGLVEAHFGAHLSYEVIKRALADRESES